MVITTASPFTDVEAETVRLSIANKRDEELLGTYVEKEGKLTVGVKRVVKPTSLRDDAHVLLVGSKVFELHQACCKLLDTGVLDEVREEAQKVWKAGWDLAPVEGYPEVGSYVRIDREVWDMHWGLFISFSNMVKSVEVAEFMMKEQLICDMFTRGVACLIQNLECVHADDHADDWCDGCGCLDGVEFHSKGCKWDNGLSRAKARNEIPRWYVGDHDWCTGYMCNVQDEEHKKQHIV